MDQTLHPGKLRIVCISDTHNDDPSKHIPDGDILLHAGDMTDDGTFAELEKALSWIRKLPHKKKIIIPGNHDLGLDPSYKTFEKRSLELFTSPSVQADGVEYLHDEKPHRYFDDSVSIYGNPRQPDFLDSDYAFTYLPHPSPEATSAWTLSPPPSTAAIDIWLTHGAPKGRLDALPSKYPPNLSGCEAQRKKMAASKPLLCVFGHYHHSYGVEKVIWSEPLPSSVGDIQESVIFKDIANNTVFDFTSLKKGQETVFVNAAWMTMEKGSVEKRNLPIVIDVSLPVASHM